MSIFWLTTPSGKQNLEKNRRGFKVKWNPIYIKINYFFLKTSKSIFHGENRFKQKHLRKIQVKQNNGETPYNYRKLSTCTQTIIWLLKIGDYAHCGGNERDSRAIMKGQKVHCIVLYRNYSDQNPRLTIHYNKDRFKQFTKMFHCSVFTISQW